MMQLTEIEPRDAAQLVAAGAVLVDIRERDEHAREHISGARHEPLSANGPIEANGPLIFHCRSGMRTASNVARLAATANGECYALKGGIEAWKAAGLATVADRGQPIEIMRQVQIIGGSLIILAVAAGWLLNPAFLILAALVGGGMLHAGVTGSCAMTKLLEPLPWNRRAAAG